MKLSTLFLAALLLSGCGAKQEPAKEISLSECTGDTACSYPTDVDDLRVISHDANQLCLAENAKGKLEKPELDTCLNILKLREEIAMRDAQAALNRNRVPPLFTPQNAIGSISQDGGGPK